MTITIKVEDMWSNLVISDSPGLSKAVLIFNNEPPPHSGGILETIISVITLSISLALGLTLGFAFLLILPQAFPVLVTGPIVALAPEILGSVYPEAPLKTVSIPTSSRGFQYYAKIPGLGSNKEASIIVPQVNIIAGGGQDLAIPFYAVARTGSTNNPISIGASVGGRELLTVNIINQTGMRGNGYHLSHLIGFITIPKNKLVTAERYGVSIRVSSDNKFLDRVSLHKPEKNRAP